ncbi:MAG: hypothetical protein ACKO37_01095 [Vampirovibrionales bacterium]
MMCATTPSLSESLSPEVLHQVDTVIQHRLEQQLAHVVSQYEHRLNHLEHQFTQRYRDEQDTFVGTVAERLKQRREEATAALKKEIRRDFGFQSTLFSILFGVLLLMNVGMELWRVVAHYPAAFSLSRVLPIPHATHQPAKEVSAPATHKHSVAPASTHAPHATSLSPEHGTPSTSVHEASLQEVTPHEVPLHPVGHIQTIHVTETPSQPHGEVSRSASHGVSHGQSHHAEHEASKVHTPATHPKKDAVKTESEYETSKHPKH